MATYPIYIRDAQRNRVESMVAPTWTLRRFLEKMNVETSQQNDRVMVGVKEYKLDQHGNKTLAELGITPNTEVNLMVNYQGGAR